MNSIAVHHTGKLAVSVAADKVLNVWDLHKVKLAAVRKLNYGKTNATLCQLRS